MDDSTLNKIKNFNHLFLFYKTFFLLGFALVFVLGLSIKNSFYSEKSSLQSFLDNWEKKPIVDIKLIKRNSTNVNSKRVQNQNQNFSLCPEGYELDELAKFPLNETLCECSESYLYDLSYGAIKTSKCSKFHYMIGCKDFHAIENLKFNSWKENYICVKRHNLSYLELKRNSIYVSNGHSNTKNIEKTSFVDKNSSSNQNKTKCCISKDTNTEDICADICPIRNIDLFAKFEIPNNKFENFTSNKVSRERTKQRNYMKAEEGRKENFTTYNDLEKYYKKNFKKNEKSQRLKNLAISDVMIVDTFPCLITENFKHSNVLNGLFNFFLHNFQYFKYLEHKKSNKRHYLVKKHSNDDNIETGNLRYNIIIDENSHFDKFYEFENIPEEKCVLYQNAYYDRRLFTLDKMMYAEFLSEKLNTTIQDNGSNFNKFENNSTDKINLDNNTNTISISSFLNKLPNVDLLKNDLKQNSEEEINFVYLISKPFFGWNKQFCLNDPKLQIEKIFNLFSRSNIYLDFLFLLKVISFIYIVFILLMQKLKIEFENGFYVGTNNCDRKVFLIADFLNFFINLMSLFNVIYLVINLKNINKYNYLELIRQNCFDDQSSRILGYLSDSCEESIIVCFLLIGVIGVDIILYSIVLMKSYTIKTSLVSE